MVESHLQHIERQEWDRSLADQLPGDDALPSARGPTECNQRSDGPSAF